MCSLNPLWFQFSPIPDTAVSSELSPLILCGALQFLQPPAHKGTRAGVPREQGLMLWAVSAFLQRVKG